MTKQRLLLLEPDTVFTARVNQTSFEYPIAEVTYDNGVSFSDVEEDYTVFFGTSAGNDDLGRQRLRAGSTIAASGTLKFGRSSRGVMDGEVALQNDAYITVFELRSVWMKSPFIDDDGTIYKDHDIAYSDQNEDTDPVANAGIGFARSLDGGTSINCDFDGTDSYATADGATISSYSWDVDDGTITVGSTSTSTLTVNFPVGFRYVSLTVTDSNGKTHTTHVPVYCRDPNSDDTLQTFEIEEHRRTAEGQTLAFRVLDDIPASTYPNGTLVMLWEGEPTSSSDRSHMKFIGWHMTDPAEIRAERTGTLKDTTLRCGDRAEMLKRLPGFPAEIIAADSPANWGQMLTPNMDKYLDFLLRWHSTALELGDYTESGTGSSYPFVILGSDGESLWDQVQSKAKALVPDYVLTCNRFGQLQVLPDPMLQDSGDRTSTVQKGLLESDMSGLSWQAQNFPRVHWLRGEAILADTDSISAVFCVAPGEAPGQGLSEQPSGEQLAQSQADLNACEGHRYARLNAPNSYFTITLAGSDDFDIDPADMTWVTLRLASKFAAQRGLTLDSVRGLPRELNITYEPRRTGTVKTIELVWEQETEGDAAVTVEYDETDFPPPDYEPPEDDGYDDDPGPGGQGDGFGTTYILSNDVLTRTRDLSASSPSWSEIGPAGITELYDFILDPWAPTTTAYLVANTGVYKSTNMDQSSPTWSLVLTKAELESESGGTYEPLESNVKGNLRPVHIEAAITVEGKVYFFWPAHTPGGQYCSLTTDGGSSWLHTLVSSSFGWGVGAVLQHGDSSTAYCYISADNARFFKSTDNNGSWSQVATIGTDAVEFVIVPYPDNASGQRIYIGSQGTSDETHISEDGGSTWSDFKPSGVDVAHIGAGGNSLDPPRWHRWALEENVQDSNNGFVFGHNGVLYTTTDGFASVTKRDSSIEGGGTVGAPLATGGFPFNEIQFYIVTEENVNNQAVFVTTDGGDTFVDKTGDWITQFGSPANRGFSVIVPLWVEE